MCRLFRPRKYRAQNKRPNFLEKYIEKTDLSGITILIVKHNGHSSSFSSFPSEKLGRLFWPQVYPELVEGYSCGRNKRHIPVSRLYSSLCLSVSSASGW